MPKRKIIGFLSGVLLYVLIALFLPISYELRLSIGLILFILYLGLLFLKN